MKYNSMEKKEYMQPQATIVKLRIQTLLSGSELVRGGKSDEEARSRELYWDDEM